MALPTSGPMTAEMINEELGRPSDSLLSLDDPEVRQLAGVESGPISYGDFYGKSSDYSMVVEYSSDGDPYVLLIMFHGYSDSLGIGSITPDTIEGVRITELSYEEAIANFVHQGGHTYLVFDSNVFHGRTVSVTINNITQTDVVNDNYAAWGVDVFNLEGSTNQTLPVEIKFI